MLHRLLLTAALLACASPAWSMGVNEDVKFHGNDQVGGAQLGHSVAIDGNVIAAGAPLDSDFILFAGSATLFDLSTGAQLFKLAAVDLTLFDAFGESIAMEGNRVLVGASGDDDLGSESGSAYVFDALTGVQLAKLLPSDGTSGSQFGGSVAISNGLAVIGASLDDAKGVDAGAAYVFDLASGTQLSKLVAADAVAGDEFGTSVSIDNGTIIVGAPYALVGGLGTGAAYMFDAATGAQLHKLTPTSAPSGSLFGKSVGVSGDLAVVGAPNGDGITPGSGAIDIFNIQTGLSFGHLFALDGKLGDSFGDSVAIHNNTIVIGAKADSTSSGMTGSVYTYEVLGPSAGLMPKLLASDGAIADRFGSAVAISNGRVAVGADGDNDPSTDSGSVYGYTASGTTSTITPFGVGLGGANTGSLITTSVPNTGSLVQLDVTGFVNSTTAFLVISMASDHAPLAGGTALISLGQSVTVQPFNLTAGASTLPLHIPTTASLIGVSFYAQAAALDTAQPQGLALSNALVAYIGQ